MDDEQLDDLLDHAARHWRLPEDPPLDQIWTNIATEAFTLPRRRAPGWRMVGLAAAAALIAGALGGRYSARRIAMPASTVAATLPTPSVMPVSAIDPNHRAMGELLGRTAILLAALPTDSAAPAIDPEITREGARLLTTTRLLLDSPVGADPQLQNLLQDLELVLAQVARIEPRHHHDEMQFIQTALNEHDLVPRLRSAAADLSLDDF